MNNERRVNNIQPNSEGQAGRGVVSSQNGNGGSAPPAVKCAKCGADVRVDGFVVERVERVKYMHLANGMARLSRTTGDAKCFCASCNAPVMKLASELMRRAN